jgi:hypothetical protein
MKNRGEFNPRTRHAAKPGQRPDFKCPGARLCAKHQSQRCGWSATQPRPNQIKTLQKPENDCPGRPLRYAGAGDKTNCRVGI